MSDDLNEFKEWPKIPRLKSLACTITEKLDGTNACVVVSPDGEIKCQSRNRFITPEDDNQGFARWAFANKETLVKLGIGRHYGEWWGQGIAIRYGIPEKRFSLFNVQRTPESVPSGVYQVPVMYTGPFNKEIIDQQMERLEKEGSLASPGFMNPEGLIVHVHGVGLYKRTFRDTPKGAL